MKSAVFHPKDRGYLVRVNVVSGTLNCTRTSLNNCFPFSVSVASLKIEIRCQIRPSVGILRVPPSAAIVEERRRAKSVHQSFLLVDLVATRLSFTMSALPFCFYISASARLPLFPFLTKSAPWRFPTLLLPSHSIH